jgi:hypothetical protein
MSAQDRMGCCKPHGDDRPLWDVVTAIWGYPAILVAHKLKLFERLAIKPLTLGEICAALKIGRRPATALLALCASRGFIAFQDGFYSLTPVSEDYLLPSSPTYFGWFLDASTPVVQPWFEKILAAVATDQPQGASSDPGGVFASWQAERAVRNTRAMHSASMAAALAWPGQLDLSHHKVMLDVGGGSGAHAIGAATIWPQLTGVVLDQGPICEVAREFAEQHGLSDRVFVYPADFFADPFPAADLHFYGMILHDWPPERGCFLVRKSFESLPAGGRIIVHEMLFDDHHTGPFPAAAFNLTMLVTMLGQQYSGAEIATMLAQAGFTGIQIKPTFGYWSIVVAAKPD